jgi:hypothetical protein
MACIGEKTGSMVIDKITAVVFVVVVRFFVESKVVGHLFPKEVSPVRRRRFAVFFVLGEKMWSKPFLNFAPVLILRSARVLSSLSSRPPEDNSRRRKKHERDEEENQEDDPHL